MTSPWLTPAFAFTAPPPAVTPQDAAAITAADGRTYRVMERSDGSICFYYTLPDCPTHFVLWDSADKNVYS